MTNLGIDRNENFVRNFRKAKLAEFRLRSSSDGSGILRDFKLDWKARIEKQFLFFSQISDPQ